MNRWDGKFVIGLTGNIGTGKSVVRRMLEHMGAYGIDADALAHRVIEKGAPGFKPVLEHFGRFVLNPNGEIDRTRLGWIVFKEPEGLRALEDIIHPFVSRAIDLIISRSAEQVIVIEAIKLLEGNLGQDCSSIWVTYSPPETQLDRLVKRRKMQELDARQRIEAQPLQEIKMSSADVVINNSSTFEETWRQVVTAWRKIVLPGTIPVTKMEDTHRPCSTELVLETGKPSHAGEIAEFLNKYSKEGKVRDRLTIMESFGEKAFLLLRQDLNLVGVAGWQVENLVSRTINLVFDPAISVGRGLPALMTQIETESKDLQCEASIVLVPAASAEHSFICGNLGYHLVAEIQDLKVPVWIEAAKESMSAESIIFFKQLRKDRILKPI